MTMYWLGADGGGGGLPASPAGAALQAGALGQRALRGGSAQEFAHAACWCALPERSLLRSYLCAVGPFVFVNGHVSQHLQR